MKNEIKGFGSEWKGNGNPGIIKGGVTILRAGDVVIKVKKTDGEIAFSVNFEKKESKNKTTKLIP